MWSCGAGFHNIDLRSQPGLTAFLQRDAESFSCDGLSTAPPAPFDAFQRISVYLEYIVAWTWRRPISVSMSA